MNTILDLCTDVQGELLCFLEKEYILKVNKSEDIIEYNLKDKLKHTVLYQQIPNIDNKKKEEYQLEIDNLSIQLCYVGNKDYGDITIFNIYYNLDYLIKETPFHNMYLVESDYNSLYLTEKQLITLLSYFNVSFEDILKKKKEYIYEYSKQLRKNIKNKYNECKNKINETKNEIEKGKIKNEFYIFKQTLEKRYEKVSGYDLYTIAHPKYKNI